VHNPNFLQVFVATPKVNQNGHNQENSDCGHIARLLELIRRVASGTVDNMKPIVHNALECEIFPARSISNFPLSRG
jgi:hypothetical protein